MPKGYLEKLDKDTKIWNPVFKTNTQDRKYLEQYGPQLPTTKVYNYCSANIRIKYVSSKEFDAIEAKANN
ncbi:MAG: hypothetical protein DRI61_03470 [Chloroflexi bacterium]|nr:MAG: hypothetical protein DRI61_03470 [Chloroflexota bacterium]